MSNYTSCSDDFYLNMNISTEMGLPTSRETVLHFFEQVQKRYPTMRNFYGREPGEFVLEEDKEPGNYRWATIEPKRVLSGYVNPESVDGAMEQHRLILDLIPHLLSVSPLDCEALSVMYGFDFTYRGNHNQLVVEALGMYPAFDKLSEIPGTTILCNEPSIQLAFDEDCRVQCRLNIETRTSAYQIRTGEYSEEQLSVYLTARRYGSLNAGETYVEVMEHLSRICRNMLDNYLVENILQPLQQAIALK